MSATAPRLPNGVAWEDVLFLWDPNAGYVKDWAGSGQALTAGGTGSVASTIKAGQACNTYGADAYIEGEPFGTSLGVIGDFTVYIVGSLDGGTAGDIHDAFVMSEPTFANGSISAIHYTAGSGGLIFDASTAATEYQTAATQYVIEQVTFEVTSTTIQSWVNGTSNGSTAHALDPGSNAGFDRLFLGGLNNASVDKEGTGFYCIAVAGSRSTQVEDWLAANFPIGIDPADLGPAPALSVVATATGGGQESNASVTVPASVQSGDMILFFQAEDSNAATTPPSGFTEVIDGGNGVGGINAAWKISDGTEGGTSLSSSNVSRTACFCAVVRGVDSVAVSALGSGDAPAIASFSGEGFAFRIATSYNEPGSYTWQSGTTELYYEVSTGGSFSASLAQDDATVSGSIAAADVTNIANGQLAAYSLVAYLAA